jgi:hypothetical protein
MPSTAAGLVALAPRERRTNGDDGLMTGLKGGGARLLGSDEDGRLIGLREGERLSPHQAAINRDYRTGHIIGQVGRQELDDPGAILHRPEPTKGD